MPPKNILLQNIDFNEFVEKNVLILRGFTLQIGTDYLKYVFGTSNWGSSDWTMKQGQWLSKFISLYLCDSFSFV